MIKMPITGERFIPTQAIPAEVLVNLERYHYALSHCVDQSVLELGCGSGLGTYLLALVAKRVLAVDYAEDAFRYASLFPYDETKVEFKQADLNQFVPGEAFDVTVALEFLEHIEDPRALLATLDTKYLIFSLPLDSLKVSTWHKLAIPAGDAGVKFIRELIEEKYRIEDFQVQAGHWVYGKAKKRKSWL